MTSGGFNKLNKVSCKGAGSIKIDTPVGQGVCFARVHAGSFAGAAGVARLRRPSGPKTKDFRLWRYPLGNGKNAPRKTIAPR